MKKSNLSEIDQRNSAERQRSLISWQFLFIFISVPTLFIFKKFGVLGLLQEELAFGLISLVIVWINLRILYEVWTYRVYVSFNEMRAMYRGTYGKANSLRSLIVASLIPVMFLYFGFQLLINFVEKFFK